MIGEHHQEHLENEVQRLLKVANAAMEYLKSQRNAPAYRVNEDRQILEAALKVVGLQYT